MDSSSTVRGERRFAAVCGLFCPGCTVYIAVHHDPARLTALARMWGRDEESLLCDGCRADRRSHYCRACHMFRCASDKGLEFCGDCDEYPCGELKAFQEEMPHRLNLYRDLERIRAIGWEDWFEEKKAYYTCPECGEINSAYDLQCRSCGRTPSCGYTEEHGDTVKRFMADRS